jgi:hypothetical protein
MKMKNHCWRLAFLVLVGLLSVCGGIIVPTNPVKADCQPGQGWSWAPGMVDSAAGLAAQQTLAKSGVTAQVTATQYGEMDTCGNFELFGFDYQVELASVLPSGGEEALYRMLGQANPKSVGKVELHLKDGRVKKVDAPMPKMAASSSKANAPSVQLGAAPSDQIFNRKVFMLVFDPLLSDGKTLLRTYKGWNNPDDLAQQTINFFKNASGERVVYQIAERQVVNDFPVQKDGQKYTPELYLQVLSDPSKRIEVGADYPKLINDYGLCTKLNNGLIDEVWVYNGPYFGFYESAMAGQGAFGINGGVFDGTTCSKPLVFMGPSVERGVTESIHNFGHRTEATMSYIYGSWQENRTSHNWDRFGLVKLQSPDYAYSGCGSVHFAPNSTFDGEFNNINNSVPSLCGDFLNYPDLTIPSEELPSVNCTTWGCTAIGYYAYWFSHLPGNNGTAPDGYLNNWWAYIFDPAEASFNYLDIVLEKNVQGEFPGTVFLKNGKILCPGVCKERIYFNHPLEIVVTPNPDYIFDNWGMEACHEFGSSLDCTINWKLINQVAHPGFKRLRNLFIQKTGTGGGRVYTTESAKIDCGAVCQAKYPDGAVVLLKPEPDNKSKFVRWTSEHSECNSAILECKALFWESHDENVMAEFEKLPATLLVQKLGRGSGKVVSSPEKINCGEVCEAGFKSDTSVTLTPIPQPGMLFTGWSGACAGQGAVCRLNFRTKLALEAQARFEPAAPVMVMLGGQGQGKVTSSPYGIVCGGISCTYSFPAGEMVRLKAESQPGSIFYGWQGDCQGSQPECVLKPEHLQTVTALFTRIPVFVPLVK